MKFAITIAVLLTFGLVASNAAAAETTEETFSVEQALEEVILLIAARGGSVSGSSRPSSSGSRPSSSVSRPSSSGSKPSISSSKPSSSGSKPSISSSKPSISSSKPSINTPKKPSSPFETQPINHPAKTSPVKTSPIKTSPVKTPPTQTPIKKPPTTSPIKTPPTQTAIKKPPTTNPIKTPPTTTPVKTPPTTNPVKTPPVQSPTKSTTAPHMYQLDPKWSNEFLGNSKTTIGKAGCAMSAVSSMVASRGIKINGQDSNPHTLNQYLTKNGGYSGDNLNWSAVKGLGFNYKGQISGKDQMVGNFKAGNNLILNVGHHWVLATGVTDKGFNVMNPGRRDPSAKNFYSFGEISRASVYEPGKN